MSVSSIAANGLSERVVPTGPHPKDGDLRVPGTTGAYAIRFPQSDYGDAQHEEWCEVYLHGVWKRIRLHDYDAIYNIPGLYEQLFARTLQCTSPERVTALLAETLAQYREAPTRLRVLDLGAGNGMVGEELRRRGVSYLVGADIIPEAADAARRDRPGLYDEYCVADFCKPPSGITEQLQGARLNTLVTVAALGFGDIPPRAFVTAFNAIESPGWLAFNIKETFFTGGDDSGFFRLIRAMWDQGLVRVEAYQRYQHRLSIAGKPLHYVGMVARKQRDVPQSLLQQIEKEPSRPSAPRDSKTYGIA